MDKAFVIMRNDYPVAVVISNRNDAVKAMAQLSKQKESGREESDYCIFNRIEEVPLINGGNDGQNSEYV